MRRSLPIDVTRFFAARRGRLTRLTARVLAEAA